MTQIQFDLYVYENQHEYLIIPFVRPAFVILCGQTELELQLFGIRDININQLNSLLTLT